MSEITWLPRGMEQGAPPVIQKLPVTYELVYRAGGDRIVLDASDAKFNPHFWLFELGTAKWRVGYDAIQRPVYELTLVQMYVFHVLLVDYWMPPGEFWRRDQQSPGIPNHLIGQDFTPYPVVGYADSSGVLAGGGPDSPAYNPGGSPG